MQLRFLLPCPFCGQAGSCYIWLYQIFALWSVTGDISLFYFLSSLFTGSAGPQAGAIVAVVEVVVLVVVLVDVVVEIFCSSSSLPL